MTATPDPIRPLTADDAEEVLRLLDPDGFGWTREGFRTFSSLASGVGRVWHSRGSGGCVAVAVGTVVAPGASLDLIAVKSTERRRGIGRRLLRAWIDAVTERGAGGVWLEVSARNESAFGLYSSEGFREIGRRPGYYRDGSDAVVMEKRWSR
ncbi:MAG TPA: GNAT family N-acetyltransferase [Myxococcales bacterium LLY-WYZ-16_1]|nr:GNAT family N-acetyltransferase [Myxococcales bacterium LLY-WYZ-16_1]